MFLQKREIWTQMYTERECHGKMKPETGVVQQKPGNAEYCQQPVKAGEEPGTDCISQPSYEQACRYPEGLLGSGILFNSVSAVQASYFVVFCLWLP